MRQIFNTLISIAFGVDMMLGCGVYVAATYAFDVHAPWHVSLFGYVPLAVFMAHAPDADFVPFLLLRRKFEFAKYGHWTFGHYPLIVTPATFVVVWSTWQLFAPQAALYAATLSTACVFAHFVHDLHEEMGFPFLALPTREYILHPYRAAHYQMRGLRIKRADPADVRRGYEETIRMSAGDALSEVADRANMAMPSTQRIVLALGLYAAALIFALGF